MVGAHPVSQLMWLASANRCAPVTHLDQSERRTRYRVKAPALARESRQKVLGTRRRSYEAHCVRAHRLATSQTLVDSATRRIKPTTVQRATWASHHSNGSEPDCFQTYPGCLTAIMQTGGRVRRAP